MRKKRRGGDLSGGQQQQLAIARALVTRPKFLVLDEPTEGIQPNVITMIGEVIRRLVDKEDMTILLVEQYVDFVRKYADSFAVMNRGRFVAKGAVSELNSSTIQNTLVYSFYAFNTQRKRQTHDRGCRRSCPKKKK